MFTDAEVTYNDLTISQARQFAFLASPHEADAASDLAFEIAASLGVTPDAEDKQIIVTLLEVLAIRFPAEANKIHLSLLG